jgi:TPR repeat protein
MRAAPNQQLASKVARWLDGNAPSDGVPLVRHLALRRVPDAMTELSRLAVDKRTRATALSAAAMAHQAARQGHAPAAYNLAMQRFNAGDLQGYRGWLRCAAQAGDGDAIRQLARFETRLPHEAARDIHRGRPYRAYD